MYHYMPIYYPEPDIIWLETYPPVCPPLDPELEKQMNTQAASLAEQILTVQSVWSELGVHQFTCKTPAFESEQAPAELVNALDYELARRVASQICADQPTVLLAHGRTGNSLILSSSSEWKERMVSQADKLARQILGELYERAEPGTGKKTAQISHLVSHHLRTSLQAQHPELKDTVMRCFPHTRKWTGKPAERMVSVASELFAQKTDCVWRYQDHSIELKRLDKAPNFWTRLALRLSSWNIGASDDKVRCC